MNQQETAIAFRHNAQIDNTWILYVHFIKEGLSPAAALDKARDAMSMFKEWADSEYLEIPIEAEKQLFSPDTSMLTEAMKQFGSIMGVAVEKKLSLGLPVDTDFEDETRL